jgi:hypothetical protein
MSGIIIVKGRRIDQVKLKAYLDSVDIEDFVTDEGYWMSPITGEIFENKHQLNGHIGAYLRTPNRKDPTEPTRAGYVRALRAGLKPSEEQKAAHAEYAAKRRRSARGEVEKPKVSFTN